MYGAASGYAWRVSRSLVVVCCWVYLNPSSGLGSGVRKFGERVIRGGTVPLTDLNNEQNEQNERNEQNELNECVERILGTELVAEELAALHSMGRMRETNVTNRTNVLMATSVFASTSATNNWF